LDILDRFAAWSVTDGHLGVFLEPVLPVVIRVWVVCVRLVDTIHWCLADWCQMRLVAQMAQLLEIESRKCVAVDGAVTRLAIHFVSNCDIEPIAGQSHLLS